jgi:hypothetical protein
MFSFCGGKIFEKANLNQMNERGDWIHPVLFEHQRVARRYISDISTGIFLDKQESKKLYLGMNEVWVLTVF